MSRRFLFGLSLLSACASRPLAERGPTIPAGNVEEILSRHSLGSRDQRASPLWQNEDHSAQLIQLRGGIRSHYHRDHTETVLVVRGRGWMTTGQARFEIVAGDCFTIPKGTAHAVEADGYLAAVAIFTPRFDGKDRVFVD